MGLDGCLCWINEMNEKEKKEVDRKKNKEKYIVCKGKTLDSKSRIKKNIPLKKKETYTFFSEYMTAIKGSNLM